MTDSPPRRLVFGADRICSTCGGTGEVQSFRSGRSYANRCETCRGLGLMLGSVDGSQL